KLEKRSDDPDLIAQVLERVQALGYQQDAQVARIETGRRGVGQFRVRQTLRRRGLDTELIDETIQAIDPDEERGAALELLSRRWSSLSRKRDPRASAYALLARRGFSGSVIWDVMREVAEQQPDDDFVPDDAHEDG
ncbi:RecX family transcriptional regulator, partial [Deinococcus sp.]|uniref:RecX family transcriptional regulator n=1 Tax=Deinococcus sp. TaxID=47478 RepID=UPI0025BE789C